MVRITRRLCEGAFEALLGGDAARHGRIVAAFLEELAGGVELIVLAQASMGRVGDQLGNTVGVLVLTSPRPRLQRAADMLTGRMRAG